jgi:pimeloyl-ACP methyl ester carboxylesterase
VRTFTATVLAAVLFFLFHPVQTEAAPITCRGQYLPVTRYPGDPAQHRVFGEFCRPARLTPSTPVQLLLHGATYDHKYWSRYARLAATRGFATLNLDRLGYGRSDHPDPMTLDLPAAGYVAHQVVNLLREGRFGPRFHQVVLNAHSLGGLIAYDTAHRGGVTAMIISGMPTVEHRRLAAPFPPFYPAEQDPKFASRGWPTGYLTTMPNTRTEMFHYPGTYTPAVQYLEEAWKDTVPEPELLAIGTPPTPVNVPTLSVLGAHDMFYCEETCPPVDATIPNAGHSINVSKDAPTFYELTFDWLASRGVG